MRPLTCIRAHMFLHGPWWPAVPRYHHAVHVFGHGTIFHHVKGRSLPHLSLWGSTTAQLFSFFAYQRLAKRRCKFEVLFVTFVGGFSDLFKITIASEVPASFAVGGTDRIVAWSRWAGWLSTCPVLLIHLSNLAGKEVFNARRMMKPPKTRPAVLRCCGWHKNVFSWRV